MFSAEKEEEKPNCVIAKADILVGWLKICKTTTTTAADEDGSEIVDAHQIYGEPLE